MPVARLSVSTFNSQIAHQDRWQGRLAEAQTAHTSINFHFWALGVESLQGRSV